jgi:hypothetical protein
MSLHLGFCDFRQAALKELLSVNMLLVHRENSQSWISVSSHLVSVLLLVTQVRFGKFP